MSNETTIVGTGTSTGTITHTGFYLNTPYSYPAPTILHSYSQTFVEKDELWDFAWIDLEGRKLVILEGKAYGTEEQAKQAATIAFCKNFINEMDDIDLYILKLRKW